MLGCAALLVCLAVPTAAEATQHTVAPGETLGAIAAHYDVTVDDLARANGIDDVNYVVAGTVLEIPGHDVDYVVKPGDNLTAVATQFGTTADALAHANGIADANFVYVGQHLKVPGAAVHADEAPPDVPVPPPASRADIEEQLQIWSDRNGLDVNLVKGLAWHESGWQQDVVSKAGAVGVMQIIPSAAEHVRRDLIGVPDLDSYSMVDNVRMGVRYLDQLLIDFDGDERLALAAYYQGERSVRSVGVYDETDHYVDNVLANRDLFASG